MTQSSVERDPVLSTARLVLVPIHPHDFVALMEGYDQFAARFGFPAVTGMRDFLVSGAVSQEWLARLRAATEIDPWRFGFGIVHSEERAMIGVISFKGPPDDEGMVELAYGLAEPYQNRGYATEAAAACITFAQADDRVRIIRAHTAPEPNASTRVLQKNGLQFLGEVIDPEDGRVWRWERPVIRS